MKFSVAAFIGVLSVVCVAAVDKQVYMDVKIGSGDSKRINLLLHQDVVPVTVENFVGLLPDYVGSIFHRIIPGFMIQGGDYENRNGTGGKGFKSAKFDDENFQLKHTGPGILSMANAGPNTNGSQFFITTAKTDWLDGRHVVFGKLADAQSMEIVKQIEAVGSANGNTSATVLIVDAGVIA